MKFSPVAGTMFGEGLAIFREGTVNGGDPGYLYQGSYEVTGDKITAKLHVKRWGPDFGLSSSETLSNTIFIWRARCPQTEVSFTQKALSYTPS